VIVDGPASGHALGMLRSPSTFGAIARVGPIASQSRRVESLLADESRSALMAITTASDMSVTETLELQAAFSDQLDRGLDGAVVNQLLPRRFSNAELERAEALRLTGAGGRAAADAVRAARELETRARTQHGHVQRLRRSGLQIATVPFIWAETIGPAEVDRIAEHLARRLGGAS